MNARPEKILAIQFKYFGDTVLVVPALRAIRERYPDCELHALVPEEFAPLLQHLPWLTRLWPMPRARGRARIKQSWPILRALRAERFDRSVDFAANDRGAILSLLIGARQRLAPISEGGFIGRRFCHTQRIPPLPTGQHECLRLAHILSAWNIPPPRSLELEIHTDPALDDFARNLLPERKIIFYVTSSQQKKEWPVSHWGALYKMAVAAGRQPIFAAGINAREQSVLDDLKRQLPGISILPPVTDLARFLAVLKRAEVFVSGDTGPLHFAAGVGVPTLSLFGPSSASQWAPMGARNKFLTGSACQCDGNLAVCQSASHCLAAITPERVCEQLKAILAARTA